MSEQTIDKLTKIYALIQEIKTEDEFIGEILLEGYSLSLNTMGALVEAGNRDKIDISDHLGIICKALGVDLKDIVQQALSEIEGNPNKIADQKTLEFITSDLDDYEKFLAQNKAKDDLDFLSKQL
jgi:DNA-binding Xre family transcriptional regulator